MQPDKNRFKGCLYGQAIGDALGVGTEFFSRSAVQRYYPNGLNSYKRIVQLGRKWERGDWTDDTEMMLCVARAILETGTAELSTIAHHFKLWYLNEPFGIGAHTYRVLRWAEYEEEPIEIAKKIWHASGCNSAANGGVMRTSVVGLLRDDVTLHAENVCRLTHADPRCVGSCVIVSRIIHDLVYTQRELTIAEILELAQQYDDRIADYVKKAYQYRLSEVPVDGDDRGYTLITLFVALESYFHASSFEEGLLNVVHAGGDADTNAAVACAILGAKFGFDTIPESYIEGLVRRFELEEIAEGLYDCLK